MAQARAGGDQPQFLYDGDCAFCTRSVQWIERWVRPSAQLTAWQHADLHALGTTQARAEHEVLWRGRDGRIFGGAQAVAKLLIDTGGLWAAVGAVLRIPPFRWVARLGYRLIANNRYRLPGGTPACALPADQRPSGGHRR